MLLEKKKQLIVQKYASPQAQQEEQVSSFFFAYPDAYMRVCCCIHLFAFISTTGGERRCSWKEEGLFFCCFLSSSGDSQTRGPARLRRQMDTPRLRSLSLSLFFVWYCPHKAVLLVALSSFKPFWERVDIHPNCACLSKDCIGEQVAKDSSSRREAQ